MTCTIRTEGVETSAFLEEFAARTLAFALWHHSEPARRVVLDLARSGDGRFRCAVRAHVGRSGVLRVRASGADAHEAIVEAADRLELALLAHVRGASEPAVAA